MRVELKKVNQSHVSPDGRGYMEPDEQKHKEFIIASKHSLVAVRNYFQWCARNMEGDTSAMLATIHFEDLVADGIDNKEAFGEAYAMYHGIN